MVAEDTAGRWVSRRRWLSWRRVSTGGGYNNGGYFYPFFGGGFYGGYYGNGYGYGLDSYPYYSYDDGYAYPNYGYGYSQGYVQQPAVTYAAPAAGALSRHRRAASR